MAPAIVRQSRAAHMFAVMCRAPKLGPRSIRLRSHRSSEVVSEPPPSGPTRRRPPVPSGARLSWASTGRLKLLDQAKQAFLCSFQVKLGLGRLGLFGLILLIGLVPVRSMFSFPPFCLMLGLMLD
uniref:Uncharacterized protein n=1 Tax=Arundo donax TaxID=35708 RepID=A0A0A9GF95_ARUDO